MKEMPLARVIFSDPPYNLGVQYKEDPTGDWLSDSTYISWTHRCLQELEPLMLPGGTFWWLVPERWADFVGPLLTNIIGPRLYRIIFEESFSQYQQTTLTDDYRVLFCHIKRPIAANVGERGKESLVFNPDAIREKSKRQEMNDARADPRGRVPGRVWTMRRLQGTSKDRVLWHPTQLCPELLQRIVKGWSNPGELIIDAFAGSGNMALVCQKENRCHLGTDQSVHYVSKMEERLFMEKRLG